MKRLVVFLGIFIFLLDLGYDGSPGRPRFDVKPCPYKLCANSQDHPADLEDCSSGNDLHHLPKANFKIDLRTANFQEIPSQFKSRLTSSILREFLQGNARKIIIVCRIGGSGAIPH